MQLRRAPFAAALGVAAGCTLIWGSLAALDHSVLGFNAWPQAVAVRAERLIVTDPPAIRRITSAAVVRSGGLAASLLLPGAPGAGTIGPLQQLAVPVAPAAGAPDSTATPNRTPSRPPGPVANTPTPAATPVPTTTPITTVTSGPVATATDTDGDGIPNSYEVAHGLDPNNAADGATDANGDGVTKAEEYRQREAAIQVAQQTGAERPVEDAPLDEPPAVTPPVETPAVTPPVETPAVTPPVETPAPVTPPAETPPTPAPAPETPPAPPAETPPAESPPAATPPPAPAPEAEAPEAEAPEAQAPPVAPASDDAPAAGPAGDCS